LICRRKRGSLFRDLTDRLTEFCGAREHHEYELYLAVENIDHSRTKARATGAATFRASGSAPEA
jgi:hypothetical protein